MALEDKIEQIISDAQYIVIVQADNPDGDSLASSLALEHILSELGKQVSLYCGTEMPGYLRYLEGWDRVQNELPVRFDASIIVDVSALILLEQLQKKGTINWLKTKPCIVIDHHIAGEPSINFADVMYLREAVSTGQIIYELSRKFNWKLNTGAQNMITTSILSDSLGLTTEATSARSIEIIAELVANGVSIPAIEAKRRAMNKKSPDLLAYKARLLERIEYAADQRIALVTIPWEEIEKYSHEYNPSILVIDEMRMVEGVAIAIAFKTYPDGRITAKLRSNYDSGFAAILAMHFGGGGHPHAAGFRISDGRSFESVKSECIQIATQLLDKLQAENGKGNETIQHTHSVI